jgi:prophage maintenance system killer protein
MECKKEYPEALFFGKEIEHRFESAINSTIYYNTPIEQAAILLFSIAHNQMFMDGNSRIAKMMFRWFLLQNEIDDSRIEESFLEKITSLASQGKLRQENIVDRITEYAKMRCNL